MSFLPSRSTTLRRQLAEEVAVVGDEEHRAAVLEEGLFQGFAGGDVQVVGRLVEQEQVRAANHDLRQAETVPLASRERGYLLEDVLAGEQEGAEQVAGLGGVERP